MVKDTFFSAEDFIKTKYDSGNHNYFNCIINPFYSAVKTFLLCDIFIEFYSSNQYKTKDAEYPELSIQPYLADERNKFVSNRFEYSSGGKQQKK